MKGSKYDFFRAFQSAPQPEDVEIAPHQCKGCDQIRRDFCQLESVELTGDILEKHSGDLPLLGPKAWRYFLPAFLSYALANPDSAVAEMLVINLDFESDPANKTPPLRMEFLSNTERSAVCAFFERYESYWDCDPGEKENRLKIMMRYSPNKSLNTDAGDAGAG